MCVQGKNLNLFDELLVHKAIKIQYLTQNMEHNLACSSQFGTI